ncbi:hypothetical protein GCM10023321_50560 [Pseudonocardia eucalypti]|uniref:Secreted protein n=1 Tax=Pseudonocardia eucalypti TaxID=648755 RepID=A0ABP9QL21_9PSEU
MVFCFAGFSSTVRWPVCGSSARSSCALPTWIGSACASIAVAGGSAGGSTGCGARVPAPKATASTGFCRIFRIRPSMSRMVGSGFVRSGDSRLGSGGSALRSGSRVSPIW